MHYRRPASSGWKQTTGRLVALVLIVGFVTELSAHAQSCSQQGRYRDSMFSASRIANIPYGGNYRFNGNWQELLLDVYLPDGDVETNRPLIILAHQGAFVIGDKFAFDAAMGRLASRLAELGYVTASINYRLGVPNVFNITDEHARHAIYRATQDMRAAVRFFRRDVAENGNTYGINPEIIIVGGSSAGAIMALHTAYMDEEDEAAAHIDTTGLGPLAGSSGNPGHSSDVSGVVNLAGALLDTSFVTLGDEPLVSAHAPDDNVVPYTTANMSFSDSVLVAHGSLTIHEQINSLNIADSLYTFYGGGHIPFSPNDEAGQAYMDTVFALARDFMYDEVVCNTSTSIEIPATNRVNFTVAPNPVRDRFVIYPAVPLRQPGTIEIIDVLGRRVYSAVAREGVDRIELTLSLAPGVYIATVNKQSRTFVVAG